MLGIQFNISICAKVSEINPNLSGLAPPNLFSLLFPHVREGRLDKGKELWNRQREGKKRSPSKMGSCSVALRAQLCVMSSSVLHQGEE